MTGPFDTVSDIKEWLNTEPSPVEAEEALEIERDGPNRTTGKSAIKDYLESVDEPGGDDDGVAFRVQAPYDGHNIGDTVYLDPDSNEARRLRRDGRLTLE